jgi:hypothetical protein
MAGLNNPAQNVLRGGAQHLYVFDKKCASARRGEEAAAGLRWERDAARRSAQKERRAVAALVIG